MASGRRQYPFHLIEPKWQAQWEAWQAFRAWNPGETLPGEHPFAQRHAPTPPEGLPKYYILDMFPYPSGAGLHVGHPEGYTATDILARYRRAKGYHVLHPMGWDAFGLPAEQYAIRTGQHPRKTTEVNIATFKQQIRSLGFSYDWSREVDTTDPEYFRWTQWIFLKLYGSWFNPATNRAEPVETIEYPAELCPGAGLSADELETRRRAFRDSKRLAYVSEAPVWWCEQLGTVLANEEVVDGLSEVGGFPVTRRPMRQWMLRITAYADRLLEDLNTIEWSNSLKEMQRNWIGRSEGAEVSFQVPTSAPGGGGIAAGLQPAVAPPGSALVVFTTRPDTLFGATYMVVAPEHAFLDTWLAEGTVPTAWPPGTPPEWTNGAATPRAAIEQYRQFTSKKSDRERTESAKDKTGVFTGVYALNPVTRHEVPVWVADYVLATYGTGAIMAVPGHDTRDFEFAEKFKLSILQVVQPPANVDWRGFVDDGFAINSANAELSLDGLPTPEAKRTITAWLEAKGLGRKTINYKLRDWLFSRQRYWGEPFPIVWKKDAEGRPYHEALPESALPVRPPQLDDYKPTPDGQPPLARAVDWVNLPDGSKRETNSMPQWAGSCWYYLRYLDARNSGQFVGPAAEQYWMGTTTPASGPRPTPGVDLYVGGTEHAVLHLLYARFWHKVLFDLSLVSTPEPFYKLVNQGLILGEDGQKMSKSRGNVINPDDILKDYGADAFRLYEMFMGPLEMVKPWSTKGVEGVYRFLGRVWRLFVEEQSETEFEQSQTLEPGGPESLESIRLHPAIQAVVPTPAQLKALHACIRKVTEDLDNLGFNTAISALMVFINEAMTWEVKPAAAMADFLILLQPFSPHVAEELWSKLSRAFPGAGAHISGLAYQPWPAFNPAYLVEDTLEIPVQVNGKLRDVIRAPIDATAAELEAAARASDKVTPFLDGKTVRKVVVVPKKLINFVAN